MLEWEWRKRNIIFELGLWSADILCFQEVDRFQELEEELKRRGYSGIWKMRTGDPVDGCAIFWRISRVVTDDCLVSKRYTFHEILCHFGFVSPILWTSPAYSSLLCQASARELLPFRYFPVIILGWHGIYVFSLYWV